MTGTEPTPGRASSPALPSALRRARARARQRGLSTVEYVIVLCLMAVMAIGTWQLFGEQVRRKLSLATDQLETLQLETSSSFEADGAGTGAPGVGAGAPPLAAPGASPAPAAGVTPPPPPPPSSGLGTDIDAVLVKSPKLMQSIMAARQQGWRIEYSSTNGTGSYADTGTKTVVIDSSLKGSPNDVTTTLAHEVGHALNPPQTVPMTGLTRTEFIAKNVDAMLDSEGYATLKALEARDELKQNGGPDIPIHGAQVPKYDAIYQDYKAGKLTRDQAAHQIGQLYADGEVASTTNKKYRETYTSHYEKEWDRHYSGKPADFKAP